MKHNHNHDNARSAGDRLVPVRFEFAHPTAATVSVAGTFNDWHPTTKTMHPAGKGHWMKETALAPGNYEYRFVVDGQWMADPLATDCVPNPFGGQNSILKVADSPEAAHLADAENLPLKNENVTATPKI
jgi:1,4-alpha-glucan branching enzyme